MPAPRSVEWYLENMVDKQDEGCWLWQGFLNPKGYSRFYAAWAKGSLGHRAIYLALGRTIPEGYVLDHLCRVRSCVNPDHLEPVTIQENTRRGVGAWGYHEITHCPHGHEYTDENTRYVEYRVGKFTRMCRECSRLNSRKYWREKNPGCNPYIDD